jgi:hypothetical protein
MDTNPEPLKDILNELFSLLESLETQSLALTQLLKDQGIATDEKLAPYLDRAENTSSVKWRAARARMQYLLSPAPKQSSEKEKDKESEKSASPEKPLEEKPSIEKTAKQKPPTHEKKPDSSEGAKDAAPNANTKAGKNSDFGSKDNEKKSNTRKESKRE